ncbi:MAG: hypothetical protein ACFFEV_08450 [Candidatus Thorarchaeota archaeon]
MTIDESKVASSEYTRCNSRKPPKAYIALVLIVVSLIMTPILHSWMTSEPEYVQTMVFILKSDDTSWFVGEGCVWFEDGSLELLSPFPAMPLNDLDDGSQIGWQAWMPADRTFQEPENCRFQYTCTELNITVGPLLFRSDQLGILYQDSFNRIIESRGGYLGTE